MRAFVLALTVATALASPALAEVDPTPGAHDPRIRYVKYDAINVVRVVATDLRSTMVQLSPDETVEPQSIAVGDEAAWQVAPKGNLIFVRPKVAPGRETNMQVVSTRKDGSHRVYQFELVPQAASGPVQTASLSNAEPAASSQEVYGINFLYPEDIAAARRKAAAERAEKMEADVVRQRLSVDLFYGPRTWRYCVRGSLAIQPSEVSDNGQVTTFRFPANQKAPGIYEVVPDGTRDGHEQLLEATARDDLLVVHGVSNIWRLRMGNDVAEIAKSQPGDKACEIDKSYNPVGINYRTNTTSPEVVREVKGPRP